jgi:tetratricopeptide (TPR) repeat protein
MRSANFNPPRGAIRVRRYTSLVLCAVLVAACSPRKADVPPPPPTSGKPSLFVLRLQEFDESARIDKAAGSVRPLAYFYAVNGYASQALSLLSALGKSMPLTVEDLYCQAYVQLEMGDLKSADEALTQALELAPDDIALWSKAAQIRLKGGDADKAGAAFARVLSLDPDRVDAAIGLARLSLQGGRDSEALDRLREIIQKHPDAVAAEALLSQLYNRLGNTAEAQAMKAMSEQQREYIPDDPHEDALFEYCYDPVRLSLRFETLMSGGRLEQALPLLDRVETLDPGSWVAPMLRGLGELRAGQVDQAFASFRAALARGADAQRLVPSLATALQKVNRQKDAWLLVSDALRQFPDSIPLLVAGSQVVLEGADPRTARDFLSSVLIKHPELYTPSMSFVQLLWSDPAQREDAVGVLLRVANRYPADLASRGLLAEYYLERRSPEKALHYLAEARGNADGNPAARERLSGLVARAEILRGEQLSDVDPAGALAAFTRALEVSPRSKEALLGAASASAQGLNYEAARAYLERLHEEDRTNPTILLSLGDMLSLGGHREKAAETWSQALAAAAGHHELETALRRRIATGKVEDPQ